MSRPPKPLLNHSNFFVESNDIMVANNGHFTSLTLLFLLPFYFSLISLVTFFHTISLSSNYCPSLPLSFLCVLLVFSLHVASMATFTYSTQQGLYSKPLSLLSTIKSLSTSFLPLATTTLASTLCLIVIPAFLLYATGVYVLALVILGLLVCFSHVNLMLAGVIAVTQSKWGLDPLLQSFYLVKGMKRSSLSILLLRGVCFFLLLLGLSTSLFTSSRGRGGGWDYLAILRILSISLFASCFTMPLLTTYTVFYLYCKELHEESGLDIAKEEDISIDCVSLAMDDDNLATHSRIKLLASLAIFTTLLALFTISLPQYLLSHPSI